MPSSRPSARGRGSRQSERGARITPAARSALFRAAKEALDKRLGESGVPSAPRRRPDHVLVEGITIGQARAALDDLSKGAGGELRGCKAGLAAFLLDRLLGRARHQLVRDLHRPLVP